MVTTAAFDPAMLLAILPEIGLLVLAVVVLALDLIWHDQRCRGLGWITFWGILGVLAVSVIFARPGAQPVLLWGGMLSHDWAAYTFRLIFLAGAALTALLGIERLPSCMSGEFFGALLVSTLGMSLMAASADLVMLYLAIETTSIPLYMLAGFRRDDKKSVEAGLKYLLFGAMSSAVMLYGFTLLYGFGGVTNLYELAGRLQEGSLSPFALIAATLLVLVGFGFKISAVPFHFWAPDVYEGAPTPVAGYLSTASKAAGFAVLLRFLFAVVPQLAPDWTIILAVLAAASMIVGNVMAWMQTNIKRMLAYSSIAQAGYMLIGVAAHTQFGAGASIYYLIAYLVTNLAAFGVVAVAGRNLNSDEIADYAGLSRRSPALALLLLAALLSLGGIPPFAGFMGKLLVFTAALQQPGLVWLAVVGAVNAVVALYYYLNVLKVVYLYRSEADDKPLRIQLCWQAALVLCAVGIVVLGVVYAPWYQLSMLAAGAILPH